MVIVDENAIRIAYEALLAFKDRELAARMVAISKAETGLSLVNPWGIDPEIWVNEVSRVAGQTDDLQEWIKEPRNSAKAARAIYDRYGLEAWHAYHCQYVPYLCLGELAVVEAQRLSPKDEEKPFPWLVLTILALGWAKGERERRNG